MVWPNLASGPIPESRGAHLAVAVGGILLTVGLRPVGVAARSLQRRGEAVLELREGRGTPDKAVHSGGNRWRETGLKRSGRRLTAASEWSVRFMPMAWCSWK
jgi:hypothetical protein